jgi:septum formation topological specificity factor MinE
MSFFTKFIAGSSGSAAVSPTTRAIARDRLSVILASQRGSQLLDGVCMEDLQRDVLKVVEVRKQNLLKKNV